MNRQQTTLGMLGAVVIAAAVATPFVRTRLRHDGAPAPSIVHSRARAPRDAGPPPRPLDTPPEPSPPRGFRLGPLHQGRSGYTLPAHPEVRFHVETGGRISSQAVRIDGGRIAFGSHDGTLYAASVIDGAVAWRLGTGDRIYSTPLVTDDGKLYFGTDADRFLAVTRGGAMDVGLATEDDADTSAARASDGTLRFASGRTLYSVDPDLTVRWRLDFGGKVFSSPAVLADGTAIVGCQDDSVYAVDANGVVKWRFPTGGDVDATPAVSDNGTVYVGSDDGALYALRASDGTQVFRTALGGYVRAGAALGLDGNVVVGTYGPTARVVAVDGLTGEIRWSHAVPGPPTQDYGVASAALVDREGNYALGTPSDELWVISRAGVVTSRVDFPGDVDSAPVLIDDGLIAVGCDDGGMYVLGDSTRSTPRE